jgi:hypothetical protein
MYTNRNIHIIETIPMQITAIRVTAITTITTAIWEELNQITARKH